MKQSIIITEVNGEVKNHVIKNSLKLAKNFVKEQKAKLTPHQKSITNFKIVPKEK